MDALSRSIAMKTSHLVAVAALVVSVSIDAFAVDSRTPHSWMWPLYQPAVDGTGTLVRGRPRRLVFNNIGDYQELGSPPPYLHAGVDIMGSHTNSIPVNGVAQDYPDLTAIPVDSTLVWVYDHNDCLGQSLTNKSANAHCRLFFRTTDNHFLYYMGHSYYKQVPNPGEHEVTTKLRNAVNCALVTSGNAAGCQNTGFTRGERGPLITKFWYASYDHMHFTIVDREKDYDNVAPFIYLEETAKGEIGDVVATGDAEAPVIEWLTLVADDSNGNGAPVIATGACGQEVSGAVDIAVKAYDTFRDRTLEPPAPEALPVSVDAVSSQHMAVLGARYEIKSRDTGAVVQAGRWYDFSQGPMYCPGNLQGTTCPFPQWTVNPATDSNYFTTVMPFGSSLASVGAPPMGVLPDFNTQLLTEGYATTLYLKGPSVSSYSTASGKLSVLILTNEWGLNPLWKSQYAGFGGLNTNWNTAEKTAGIPKFPDGLYQIDVTVHDEAGHTDGRSMIVRVHNDPASSTSGSGFSDIYVRDSDADVGAIPSNVGGHPFWTSPDILVVPPGKGPDLTMRIDQLATETDYHVYLQVHYDYCNTLHGLQVRLAASKPSTLTQPGDWVDITTGGFVDSPNGSDVTATKWIGPFTYRPTAAVTVDGHSCLLGAVKANEDTTTTADMTDVPGHNNVAQRNIQIGKRMTGEFGNPFSLENSVTVRLSARDMSQSYTLTTAYDATLQQAWSTAGPDVAVSTDGSGNLVLTIKAKEVTLPAVTLPPHTRKTFTLDADVPIGSSITVDVTTIISAVDVGGMTLTYNNIIIN
jgi:hypothetical protein